ncbi:cystatin-B-like [Mixophyes fleayi]|uniref:cystatin-B-like n=1 Tax=Mixophyes fleayi TaxID=3061075 RepID=UPI003F4DA74B
MPRRGGLGVVKPADDAVQSICDQMRKQAEEKTGRSFSILQAVEYKTQTVAGRNYFIKAHIGSEEFIHLRVYEPLPCYNEEMSLTAVQLGKTRGEEIKHFEPHD